VNNEFGSRSGALLVHKQNDIGQALLVAAGHVNVERPEGILSKPSPTLIDIMDQILGDQAFHLLGVTGIECSEIRVDQKTRLLVWHWNSTGWCCLVERSVPPNAARDKTAQRPWCTEPHQNHDNQFKGAIVISKREPSDQRGQPTVQYTTIQKLHTNKIQAKYFELLFSI
jgi:hypothetical protein